MRLAETFPHHQNLKFFFFFDNYFTSVLLLRELKMKVILATGTIRSNQLWAAVMGQGCPLRGDT